MNVPTRELIAKFAEKLIRENKTGVRWGQMFHATRAAFPDVPKNTIVGSLHTFRLNLPAGIANPSRGLYQEIDSASELEGSVSQVAFTPRIRESDFYEAFASWLRDEIQEATVTAPFGGNGFGGKWGTPDVIGLYRPQITDIIKFPEEVISAEIKIDTHQLIVAFGQACAYKLFSHRVYLVVPASASQDDLERLDALASVVGVGLVKFNADNPEEPDFRIMTRAAKHEPDYFYVNKVMPLCVHALRLQSI